MKLTPQQRRKLRCVLCHHGVDEWGDRLCRYPTCACINTACVPAGSRAGREIKRLRRELEAALSVAGDPAGKE